MSSIFPLQNTRLISKKDALAETRIVNDTIEDLNDGEVLFEIQRVALTANNITYAAFGDAPNLRYWEFFPTHEADWGHMPVWGFANVIVSGVEGIEVGERFYGFFPMATHLIMQPIRVSERGFYDGAAHRQELTSVYNQYTRVSYDAAYRPENENYQMLLRPLFITSFMLADFLQDNAFFGAKQILFSSASSKTAYGTAFCLQNQGVELIGLTSTGNLEFVNRIGCYARSVSYSSVTTLAADVPTVYVDFSGQTQLRETIHHYFADHLVYDCYAGSTQSHTHISKSKQELPGPKPRAYFAPVQIKKRNADWGPREVTAKCNTAELAFIEQVKSGANPWINVKEHIGFEQMQSIVAALVDGKIDPQDGQILLLSN